MADIMDKFWSIPPVSRTIIASVFTESLLVYSGMLSGYRIVFGLPFILKFPFPEIWRLYTSFLLTSPQIGFLFDMYMFWQYTQNLEVNSPRFSQPGDFATYVVFICTIILLTGGVYLGGVIFTHALLLAFVYTWAQDNRGKKAHFYFFQIPAEYLPWAMLLLTMLTEGPGSAKLQFTGILAAHMHDFLTRLYPAFQGGRNYLQTPTFVRNYFSSTTPTGTQRAYGTSYQPAQRPNAPAASSNRGWTSGFSSGAWSGRGSGHRLGGD